MHLTGFCVNNLMQRIQYAKTKSDCIAKEEGSYVPREKKRKQEEKGEELLLMVSFQTRFFPTFWIRSLELLHVVLLATVPLKWWFWFEIGWTFIYSRIVALQYWSGELDRGIINAVIKKK